MVGEVSPGRGQRRRDCRDGEDVRNGVVTPEVGDAGGVRVTEVPPTPRVPVEDRPPVFDGVSIHQRTVVDSRRGKQYKKSGKP